MNAIGANHTRRRYFFCRSRWFISSAPHVGFLGDVDSPSHRLSATQDNHETVAMDVTFFIPRSPSLPDGRFSNEHLLRAMRHVAAAVRAQGK